MYPLSDPGRGATFDFINYFFLGYGTSSAIGRREVGRGSIYYMGYRDGSGAYLDGGIQTKPGEGWWSAMRVHGPQEPAFDGSWRLGDIVETQ